jgi:hypothetical protein
VARAIFGNIFNLQGCCLEICGLCDNLQQRQELFCEYGWDFMALDLFLNEKSAWTRSMVQEP